MKKLLLFMMVCGMVGVVSAAFVETFDSDSANWNYGYGTGFAIGTTTWNASGGNPDGHISGASANLYAIWTYDTAAYGDMTGLTMTIDTKITDAEVGTAQFYVGKGNTYYINGTWSLGGDTAWATHQTTLDAAHFTIWTQGGAGNDTLANVLAAPDDIGIFFGGNLVSGSGVVLVDNFGTIPEPATMLLLGLGGLLIRRKK